MILTLTPNPSLDLLYVADELCWDDANRVATPRARAGGQGVNMARAARALGARVHAIFPAGGPFGAVLVERLRSEGTSFDAIPIAGDTRLFVGVRELSTGRSMLVNPRGPQFTAGEIAALSAALAEALRAHEPRWLACCGSLPPGFNEDFYAEMGALAREAGVRFLPDCDGAALRAAAPVADALVPNLHEAERLLGTHIDGIDSAAANVRMLAGTARAFAVIKMGAEGAVMCVGDEAWHAAPPRIDGGSAVGAGDTLLAALLHSFREGAAPADAIRYAVAAGSAVLLGEGEDLVTADTVEAMVPRVEVRKV